MTWGEIEGTPFRLDGSDTPLPHINTAPYKMHEQSKRERIALELAEKVSQRYRDKKAKAIEAARSHLATYVQLKFPNICIYYGLFVD